MGLATSILNILRFNRKNWKALALCFFAAAIFWIFNALNKNYTTNLSFPLEFEYDTEKYIAVSPLPTHARINVTGIGWDLFRRSAGLKVPSLVISLERPSEVKKIVAVPALFAPQLERFQVNFVLSDTLRIAIEPIERRHITIRLDAGSISLAKGFIRINAPVLQPDSVLVEGPMTMVRSFIEPVYLKLADENINENYNEDVEVQFLNNELIKRNPPTVNVSFKVDKLVQISDSIPLKIINYPKGAKPYLAVTSMYASFSVPQSMTKSYEPDSVVALVDLRFFSKGEQQIKPVVTGLPPYSVVHHIDTIYVKF